MMNNFQSNTASVAMRGSALAGLQQHGERGP